MVEFLRVVGLLNLLLHLCNALILPWELVLQLRWTDEGDIHPDTQCLEVSAIELHPDKASLAHSFKLDEIGIESVLVFYDAAVKVREFGLK